MPRDQKDFVETLSFPGGSFPRWILEHPVHTSWEASPDVCVFKLRCRGLSPQRAEAHALEQNVLEVRATESCRH